MIHSTNILITDKQLPSSSLYGDCIKEATVIDVALFMWISIVTVMN